MAITKAVKLLAGKVWKSARREVGFHALWPKQAILFLTYRCTGRCQICTMWRRPNDPERELSFEAWRDVLDQLAEQGVELIEFFGGDALLRKDVLVRLIAYARSIGLETELPTNSILLDHDMAREMVEAGLDLIFISLDGTGNVHDQARGKQGNFERVDGAVAAILESRGADCKPKIIINTVISKLNLDSFESVIDYARRVGADAVDLGYLGEIPPESLPASSLDGLVPTPFFTQHKGSQLLDTAQAVRLKAKMRQIRTQPGGGPRVNTVKVDLREVKDLTRGLIPNPKCYICRQMVTIDPYGNLVGCMHFNNYQLGNVTQEPLKAIWGGARHRRFISHQLAGGMAMCHYCPNGMHNATFLRSLEDYVYESMRWAKDDPKGDVKGDLKGDR